MNNFIHNRSLTAVACIIVCALALFADGANITDLFPSATTIHFDEVLEPASPPIGAGDAVPRYADYSRQTHNERNLSSTRVAPARFVMLDQDSPSEPVSFSGHGESIGTAAFQSIHRYAVIFSHDDLYLNYCTLLL
ncbi:MAG TPA: hypothetical protein VMW43_03015 [Bacteroidota bacterium]|nr:hypothetical protein [Bacteroidota bacterium]